MSRRTFLRLTVLASIGAGAAIIDQSVQPVGIVRLLRWLARGRVHQLTGQTAIVGLQHCPSYDDDLAACLYDLWQMSDMPAVAGKRVLLKPNLVDSIEGHPASTAPELVDAAIDVLRRLGTAELVVGDGPAFRRDAWPVVEATGLAPVLARRKVPFVDLNYDEPKPVATRNGWFLEEQQLWLPRHVREADLVVSLPKLKTHHWAEVSLSLKNLFGVIPGTCYGWPKNLLHINGIPLSILGLYEILPPVVSVVDGIVGMEGDGPLFGTPVNHGLVAVGQDPVAVDATCAELMGLSVEDVTYLRLAKWAGVGQSRAIEVRGATKGSLSMTYKPPPRASANQG
jgi:uncharacterized protein (DUF362 family)